MSSVVPPPVCRRTSAVSAASSAIGPREHPPARAGPPGRRRRPARRAPRRDRRCRAAASPRVGNSVSDARSGQVPRSPIPSGSAGSGADRTSSAPSPSRSRGSGWPRLMTRYEAVAVRDLGEHGRGEALELASRPSRRSALPRERPLQALRDRLQGRLLLGRLPEGADDDGHGGHRAHALPAYVAHDEPHTVRGVLHRVQVAPDEGARLCGLVAGRDLQAADALGGLGQDGALGRLGDLAHGGELLGAAPHDAVDDTGEYGDGGDRDQFGDGVAVVTAGVSRCTPSTTATVARPVRRVPRGEKNGAATSGAAVNRGTPVNVDGVT